MWVVLLITVHFILFVKAVSVGGLGKEKNIGKTGKSGSKAKMTPWIF